jgi:hypothetical protein
MEIRPASLAQIAKARNAQMVEIDDDVQGVANALNHIDSHICLRFSEAGGYFVVYWKPYGWEDGSGYQITTAQDLDHRIVKRVEDIYAKCKQPGYSFAKELEQVESDAKAEKEHEEAEQNGEMLEKLAHAMRKDLGYDKQKIFIPEAA